VTEKDMPINAPCIEEFNKNALRTVKERLNAIEQYKNIKNQFRIQTKKKDLLDISERKLMVTEMNPKQLDANLKNIFLYNDEKFKNREKRSSSPHSKHKKDQMKKLRSESPKIEPVHQELDFTKDMSHPPFQDPPQRPTVDSKAESTAPKDKSHLLIFPDAPIEKPKEGTRTHQIELRQTTTLSQSIAQTPKSDYDSPRRRVMNKDVAKALVSQFAQEHERQNSPHRKSKSPNKNKNPSQVTYVFDSATETINEKGEYQASFDVFVRKVQPFNDPFEVINEKYKQAVHQKSQLSLTMGKKNHTRDLFNTKAPSRPQTANNLKSLKLLQTHTLTGMTVI
jgi:hypothetical protein